VASLVDTNVLLYRYDPRSPRKRQLAEKILRPGAGDGSVVLAHQTILEFVRASTREKGPGTPLLDRGTAIQIADMLLQEYDVLFPTEPVLRTALMGAAAYQLPWYDAHMWAYAEVNGIPELLSEDFQSGRVYGRVRIVDPFL
jgi:predicted nucleic acid-binding protein